MNKNRFFEKNKWLGIPLEELERMWLILKEQLDLQGMIQAFGVGGGGRVLEDGSEPTLTLTFDSISNVTVFIPNPLSVAQWNAFFNLPALGQPFTSVSTSGNSVLLKGGSGIKLKPDLMYPEAQPHILAVSDTGCVTSVGGGALADCPNLSSVDLPLCAEVFGNDDSPLGIYGGLGGNPSLTTVNLPLLTTAGDKAFFNNLILIFIEFQSLTTSGTQCFSGCTSAVSIDLPSLITAGSNCFSGCQSVTTVSLPLLSDAGDGCFTGLASITNLTLPSLVTGGSSCFSGNSALETINLPVLTTTGDGSFENCPGLTSISAPLLQLIPNNSFSGCVSLISISLPSVTSLTLVSFASANLASITLDGMLQLDSSQSGSFGFLNGILQEVHMAELTVIDDGCGFSTIGSLSVIDLPKLQIAGDGSFSGTGIISANFPELTTIGNSGFGGCTSLTTVQAPLLETAGYSCFLGCSSLSTLSLPSLINAGNDCFNGCSSLSTVAMPSLEFAGVSCFSGTAIVTLSLPSLLAANINCFQNCTFLNSVDLPLATTIGDGAFADDNAVETILLPSCTSLGASVLDNSVFEQIVSPWTPNPLVIPFDYPRYLTVPQALMTCNSGNPDGDILYLIANNPGLVITAI